MKHLIILLFLTVTIMGTALAQTGKYATVNGLNMYYEIHGSGKLLVLIHGAASTTQTTFGRLLLALAKAHKIIAVELQAHGHSDNRDGRQITFEQDAYPACGLASNRGLLEFVERSKRDLASVGSIRRSDE